MPLIDVRCTNDHVSEVHRALADYPKTPPCPECGAETVQTHLPKTVKWQVDPTVVFLAPDGSPRFPGDAHGISAAHYRRQGFKEVEIRNAAEMRSFEKTMSKQQYSEMARKVEAKQAQREAREKFMRGKLREVMGSMTPFGRAVAREAMRRGDAKPIERVRDAGFHSEVYSVDRSNRTDSRDSSGRRRRD